MYWLIKIITVVSVGIAIVVACKTSKKKVGKNREEKSGDIVELAPALYPVSVKGKWGYIDHKFELVIEPQFDNAEAFNEGLAVVSMKTVSDGSTTSIELQGYIDSTGKIVIPCEYDRAFPFSEGIAVVESKGKYGFVNSKGSEALPLIFDEGSKFSEGLAVVKVNGKNGFINKEGKMVISPQFARACWVSDFSEGLAAVYTSEDGPGGYIDNTGKMMIAAKYSYVGSFSERLALVQPLGQSKYGYINTKGDMVIEPMYESGVAFSEGHACVKLLKNDGSEVYRVIDTTGRVVADNLRYAFVGIFREGLAGVESYDHRWGFIDKSGKEVIKPQFAGAKLFKNGLSRMETGSLFSGLKVVYIDKRGKVVWQE